MTGEELSEIVDGPLVNPRVLGRLACNLRDEASLHQHNFDDRTLTLAWKEMPDVSRCIVSFAGEGQRLAQIDIHENATVSIETSAPCKVTVSQDEGFLCLTRFRQE